MQRIAFKLRSRMIENHPVETIVELVIMVVSSILA